MANHNDYDDILKAARDKQRASDQSAQQQQQAQQEADARVKAEALAARQKTLGLAAYVANLLSQHHVMPTMRLVERIPGVATKSFFGKVTYSPDTTRVIAAGWPVMQGRRNLAPGRDSSVRNLQGLLLTPEGGIMQYVDSFGSYHHGTSSVPEPLGDIAVQQSGLLSADPKDDAIVAWEYKGSTGGGDRFSEEDRSASYTSYDHYAFSYAKHQKTEIYHSFDGTDHDIPNIETAIQQYLGQLAAKLVPDDA